MLCMAWVGTMEVGTHRGWGGIFLGSQGCQALAEVRGGWVLREEGEPIWGRGKSTGLGGRESGVLLIVGESPCCSEIQFARLYSRRDHTPLTEVRQDRQGEEHGTGPGIVWSWTGICSLFLRLLFANSQGRRLLVKLQLLLQPQGESLPVASQDQPVSALDASQSWKEVLCMWAAARTLPGLCRRWLTGARTKPHCEGCSHTSEVCEPAVPAHGGRASFCPAVVPTEPGRSPG